jgi:DNA-binding XRE family transcriptional regulator
MNQINLKELRKNAKLTQQELAERLGVDRRTIINYEKGETIPESKVKLLHFIFDNESEKQNHKPTIADYKHIDGKFVESNRFPKEVIIITAKSGMNLQSHYYADELMEELEKRIIYIDHDAKGRYFEIEGEGDSMNDGSIDSILDGDKLLLREIPRIHWKSKFHINKWDFTFFHYDRGFITKRIKEHNVDTGDLLLESRNPDKTLYPDFWINLKECAIVCNVVEIRRQKGAYYSL